MHILRTVAALALVAVAAPAAAQHGPLGHYNARLGPRDHFNSSGQRLLTVAGVLRQDRANFFRYNRGDAEDQADDFFDDANNRAAFERMLLRSRIDPRAARAIINGQPMVHVDIFEGYVLVTVL